MVLQATVSFFEDSGTTVVYATDIANDYGTWQLKMRYSKFETLYKAIKEDVAGVVFPGSTVLVFITNHFC